MRAIFLLMVLAIVIQSHCASTSPFVFELEAVGRKIEETASNTRRQAQNLFGKMKAAVVRTPQATTTTTIPTTTTSTTTTTPPTPTTGKPAVIITTCKPDVVRTQSSLSEDEIRTKLCSNATSSRGYRFDLDAKVCSPVGQQAHCGKNMIFYSYTGNLVYGHCDCNYATPVPLLYHAETDRCYFIYQQAFCGAGEWLEMRKADRQGICTNNTCYNAGRPKFGGSPLAARDMEPEYVPLRGAGPCVKLNQPNHQFCKKKGEVITFRWPLELYPNCGMEALPLPEIPSVRFLGEVPSLQCSPGSYLDIVGHCQPDWDFD